ncbi:pyr operon leader peptide [Pseudocitrobacter faecalis]|nr:pyr operon leader peptide [Pseudocitrobacter faecalis]
MVQCVRHRVLPRLKTDAGLPFSFRCSLILEAPYLRGFFCAGVRRKTWLIRCIKNISFPLTT